MTTLGRTCRSRPVVFNRFAVIPQIGVISDPAYVVGTARIGRCVSLAIAFAVPIADPPPTSHDGVGPGCAGRVNRPRRDLRRNVHDDLVEPTDEQRCQQVGQLLPGLRCRVRDQQWPGQRQPVQLGGELPSPAGTEHHSRTGNVVHEPHETHPFRSVDALEHGGEALAAADAHGLQAVAGLAAVHLAGEGGEDPGAGGADGVAQRDAGAVDVDPLEVLQA